MHVNKQVYFSNIMNHKTKQPKSLAKHLSVRKLIAVIFCFLVILAGYFFWIKPKYNQANVINASTNSAVEVTVVTVQKENPQLFIELPARVSAFKIAEIRPQIDGIIKKQTFTEGSFVKKGQMLYQIDPSSYQNTAEGSNNSLKAIRAKRDRYKILLEQDAISKQEFEDANSALGQAQSDAKKGNIYAPISGYIGKSNVTEGMLVTANQTTILTTIAQLDPIYVDMSQASKDAVKLGNQKDIPVSVITEDPTYQNIGKLKFSEVFVDESTDSVRLRALFSNKDKKLMPGMFVNARMHLKSSNTLTVPQRATNRAPDGSLIAWVVDKENVVKPRTIKADQISGDSWVVIDGLSEGEVIVYEGFQKIADGAKVNPVQLVVPEGKIEEKVEEKK